MLYFGGITPPYANDLRQSQSSLSPLQAYFLAACLKPFSNIRTHQNSGPYRGICTPKQYDIADDIRCDHF